MQEDALWVKQTLAGDGEAFHRLIIKYYAAIYAVILSRVKNTEDARDLMQEVFFEAYRDLASLRHPEQFRVWLQQIARHQCHDWLRKRQEIFTQLDEDMICETPSADELLILQETLAKVMKAIDELPEPESQLLKERYLDDVSYDELESRHGLSRNALAVRLVRARQHVREKIKKVLPGLWTLPWQDVVKKMLLGGIEAMKISAKVKIVSIGVAAVLIISGTGIVVWHSHESNIKVLGSPVSQMDQGKVSASHTNLPSSNKDNSHKLAEKQKDEQADKIISWLDSLGENPNNETKVTKTGIAKAGETMPAGEANKPKFVKDFPEFDLSTPESAWATIMRIMARSRGDWTQVSLRKNREMEAQYPNDDDVSPEQSENFLNAEILEVHINGDRAGVISQIPNQSQSIDLRSLAKEDGEWRNVGNDRISTIEEARQKFENGLNRPIP